MNHKLLLEASDRDGLLRLLSDGLDWPVNLEFPLYEEPEIGAGIKSGVHVNVHSLVPSAEDDRWLIVLAEFEQEYVRRDLRALLTSLRRYIRETDRFPEITGYSDTIFIVVSPGYQDIRFVLFEERERRLPRIRSFGWRREFIGRTVLTHNLERLRWSDRDQWEKAWDVEGLTEEFYAEFVKVFDAVKAATSHPEGEDKKHAYVQQLLNRLLFISFIERMGWLRTPEPERDSDYLHAQWLRFNDRENYANVADKSLIPATFNGLLGWLFFRALDNPNGVKFGDRFYPILGEVPYLNGGLFSEVADLDVSGVTVQDEVFDLIFGDSRPGFEGGLFRMFNFTVTESTPLDQEVAVDPEMLGKIFERLIIKEERHQIGAYYTPRPIVEFMVNEALKGYLTERGLPADKAALLVDEDRVESETLAFRPAEMQDTLDWLFEVRAVDPACGSGAYLLMLLQRLFELVDRLEVVRDRRRNPDQKQLYTNKLRLLERCVYGVDISEIAVRIARLRLWLSLVVENRGEKPEPLPNFDFLIMCGDSLASPVKPDQHTLGYPHDAIREYTRLKRLYFHPRPGHARPMREEMQAKRTEIATAFRDELASSRLRSLSKKPFDWEVEFAEVFDPLDSEETLGGRLNLGLTAGRGGQDELAARTARPPGFDIVLANPPYVREQLISMDKSALRDRFPQVFHGKADLYTYFYAIAAELLADGGQLAFITPNRWLKTDYAVRLRNELRQRFGLSFIVDFDDLPVFQGQVTYSLITIATKGRHRTSKYVRVKGFTPSDTDIASLARHESRPIVLPENSDPWREATNVPGTGTQTLGKVTGGGPYLGLKTGFNNPFYLNKAEVAALVDKDPSLQQIIRPLIRGQDIRKWLGFAQESFVLWTHDLESLEQYPVLVEHFRPFRDRLEQRQNRGVEFWQFRSSRLYGLFDKPKIVFPDIAARAKFAVIQESAVVDTTAFFIPSNDAFMLAILNSSPAEALFDGMGVKMRGGFFRFNKSYSQNIPVPFASDTERVEIAKLVDAILERKAADLDADVSDLEAEIDRRVEFLYFGSEAGRTYDEAMAYEREEIRNLLRRHAEDATLEFKETLWWDVKQGQYQNDRVLDVAKAICAMINRDGGTILIGVADDGNRPVGIARDMEKLETPDRFQRKIAEPFGQKLRPDPSDLVRVRFIDIDGLLICRVDVKPDRMTVYHLNDKVYVRRDGESREITGPDLAFWGARRQRGET